MGIGVPAKPYTKAPAWLRSLDVQDLCLLSMAFNGILCRDISKLLHISFPAVSQRVKKISTAVGFQVFYKHQGTLQLTEEGRALAEAIDRGLSCMYESGKDDRLPPEGDNTHCGFLGPGDDA